MKLTLHLLAVSVNYFDVLSEYVKGRTTGRLVFEGMEHPRLIHCKMRMLALPYLWFPALEIGELILTVMFAYNPGSLFSSIL